MLVVNIDVAYLSRRRSSLTEHEKYNFYCLSRLFTSVFEKVELFDLQLA